MRAPLIGKVLLRHLAMQMHCRYTERQHMRSWIVRIEVWFQNLPIIGAWPVGQCQCSLCGRSRNTVSRRHSPHFVWSQGKERVHKCPSSIVSSNSASEGFASLLIKPEVVSTHVNAQVWLFADECDQSATELICLSWTWLFFFHYRWLWQRSVCGSSRKASTASDTQRSSKIVVNLIHVVHFGNLWNNDIYVYHIVMYESYSFKATI